MVLNIINGNFGLVKSWQKSSRFIGANVLFVLFWSHSKPHSKTQLEWPKRLAQLDNQLDIKGETYRILIRHYCEMMCMCVSHSFILPWTDWENTLSWALVELEWKLRVFSSTSNFCFEIHCFKVCSLVLKFWNLHSICYQLRMK